MYNVRIEYESHKHKVTRMVDVQHESPADAVQELSDYLRTVQSKDLHELTMIITKT